MRFRRQPESDLRRLVRSVSRRERHLAWVRSLPSSDLDRLVDTIEGDLVQNPDRDSLLEHLARLHFDTTARARSSGREALVGDTDTARCAVESILFERRYGEPMIEALGSPDPLDDGSEAAHLYVEGAFRRLGLAYTYLSTGHWVIESSLVAVHLHHYPQSRVLDVYAPLRPVPDDDREELFQTLLAENGGSIAGAFYGIWSFTDSGDHLCVCGRVSTEHLAGPDLAYVLNSVFALAEAQRDEL
ncbi:MAG TPA: hypothetical protein VGF46_01265 [Gaiellales bacterium]